MEKYLKKHKILKVLYLLNSSDCNIIEILCNYKKNEVEKYFKYNATVENVEKPKIYII